jgi:hypothetical protein
MTVNANPSLYVSFLSSAPCTCVAGAKVNGESHTFGVAGRRGQSKAKAQERAIVGLVAELATKFPGIPPVNGWNVQVLDYTPRGWGAVQPSEPIETAAPAPAPVDCDFPPESIAAGPTSPPEVTGLIGPNDKAYESLLKQGFRQVVSTGQFQGAAMRAPVTAFMRSLGCIGPWEDLGGRPAIAWLDGYRDPSNIGYEPEARSRAPRADQPVTHVPAPPAHRIVTPAVHVSPTKAKSLFSMRAEYLARTHGVDVKYVKDCFAAAKEAARGNVDWKGAYNRALESFGLSALYDTQWNEDLRKLKIAK